MSLWGSKNASGIKPVKPQFRSEKVPIAKKSSSSSSSLSVNSKETNELTRNNGTSSPSLRASPGLKNKGRGATTPTTDGDTSDGSRLQVRKRKAVTQRRKKKLSPGEQRVVPDNSEEDEGVGSATTTTTTWEGYKKLKREGSVDYRRQVRSERAFSDGKGVDIVHAADITEPGRNKIGNGGDEVVMVELKYPSLSKKERYLMVFERDKIEPLEEILAVANIVTNVYLMDEQRQPFTDPNTGIIRKLERAKNMFARDRKSKELRDKVMEAVGVYNNALENLLQKGTLAENLDGVHHLPRDMVQLILRQVYDRAVSPKVDILKQYENGTDNVYGELLYPFCSDIFKKTNLKSDQVFVDLGSGVGNVVLQAALEVGCESWGCEMMENACKLAKAQKKEFAARCRLWGIQTGEVRLENDNFLENDAIHKAMRRADVILVNNQAFTSPLNRRLIELFLDVKDGCKIISLKSFVPQDHKITSRNAYDPVNVLDVKQEHYGTGIVSWTNQGGDYFIARKDSKRLEKFSLMN